MEPLEGDADVTGGFYQRGRRRPELTDVEVRGYPENTVPLIVVPLDGSVEAKDALPAARLAARIAHATIHVVHAVDHPVSREELLKRVSLRPEETHELVIDQVVGRAADAVVRYARERGAMLIVMTTRGKTAYKGRTVRPVVEEIICKSPTPVLLVRPEIDKKVYSMTTIRRILLPLDGAPSSAAVIRPALDLAQQSGAQVDILYVATRERRPSEPGALTAPLYIDQPQYEWPSWAQEFVRRFGTCLGDPATEIVRFATERDADLIVLEWRGRMDPAHARVVKGVLTNAPCPVLLLQTGHHYSGSRVETTLERV
jgi:nucleotide-binding universal stress UspA family protein